jgi:hypothetical protein
MPWSQTSPMDQKTQFIADYLRETLCMSELCELDIYRERGSGLVYRERGSGLAMQHHLFF